MVQKWLLRNWKLVAGLLLLAGVGYGVFDFTHSLWAVVLVLGAILSIVLLVQGRQNASHTSCYFFEDDFACGLHAWEATPGWPVLPSREGESGIQLVHHYHLSRVLLLKTYPRFVDGVIECQVCLEPGALFSLLLRGSLEEDEFYLARLDSTPDWGAGILYKRRQKHWLECDEKKATRVPSPPGQWLNVRVVARGRRVALYCNERLLDQIDNARVRAGRIGMFAELDDVHVRRVRVFPA